MKGDKGTQNQKALTLKDNQNTPNAKRKQSSPSGLQINLKDYMSSFDCPKEGNTNNSFYENFLNHIQEDKKMLSSCNINNDGEVKSIHVKNANSNFMSVRKISFQKGNSRQSKKGLNTGEGKLNEEEIQENNNEKDNISLKRKQSKNINSNNEEEQNKPKEEIKEKKKLKVQRTKAPPQLIRKKNFIFCCIPVTKK